MAKFLKICLLLTLVVIVFYKYCTFEMLEKSGFGAGNGHRMRYGIDTKYKYSFFKLYIDTLINEKNLSIPNNWAGIKKTISYDDSTTDRIVYFKEKSEFYHFSLQADGIVLLSVFQNGNWITDRNGFKDDELKRISLNINNLLFIGLDSIAKSRNIPNSEVFRKLKH
jgi:hypothetical protein